MQVKLALATGLAVTAAQAMLITPELVPADGSSLSLPAIYEGPIRGEQSIDIRCPGCPVDTYPLRAEDLVDGTPPNHLEITFSIDDSAQGDRLLANGFELYPNPDPFTNSLAAPQVLDDADAASNSEKKQLGYKLQAFPVASSAASDETGDRLDIIRVDLQIIEVGETFVSGIPSVQVDLLKTGDMLSIAKITTIESSDDAADCTTILCKIKSVFDKKLSMFKGPPCPGKMGHGRPPMAVPQGDTAHSAHSHGFQEPGRFRHHGHAHGFGILGFLLAIIINLVLPILFGIVVGVTTGIIGMAIVSAVMRIYSFVRGSREQAPPSYKACSTEEVVVDEEKDGLIENEEHVDPPPSYGEEAPAPRL